MPFPVAFPGEAYLKVGTILKAVATGQALPYSRYDSLEAAYDVLGDLTKRALSLAGDQPLQLSLATDAPTNPEEWFAVVGKTTEGSVQAVWSVPSWAIPIILELVRKLLETQFGK